MRGPRAGHNIGIFHKKFLIPGARKHTHVPPQVTTGASLFRSGTYRTWKDKVHGIAFPEKSAQDQEERDYFIKRDCSLRGSRECVSLWIPHSRCPCHPRAGADLVAPGVNLFPARPSLVLTNLRNEGWGGGGY